MKTILLNICLFLSIASCNLHSKPMAVRQFYPYSKAIDTIFSDNKMLVAKFDYFIISNYAENDLTDYKIDSMAKSNMDKDWQKYSQYEMSFYKESKYTNEEYIKKDPRSIDRYSQEHDLRYSFAWSNGKFESMSKYKNGELTNPACDIRIGPEPKSK